ncbi:hypothetical protein [Bradyrhizobium sp. NAS96.2]|uniref:hypothetical protein n=1 Tax=Bradyrhizobium sp. NAS96.2 TaxID=1680160 RepID=UPI00093BBB0F|nr:hypothetical protein [Bradyrhizobium sp. NAS96.2]OKO73040.1 hypothetical protein AC628_25290 [Bradyrhizobium sp. NAS96.2]
MRINPFRKLSEAEKRIAELQAELKSARSKLAEVDFGKAAALADSVVFAKWSGQRAGAAAEVERLTALIETIETDAEIARRSEADAAKRRETAAARKAAEALANRVQTEGRDLAGRLLSLMQECARQSLAAKVLNADLPEGEAPIPSADILARDIASEPRKDIRSRDVVLWVAETNGVPIGDQAAVASDDGVRGQADVGSMRVKCVRRDFHETEYHPIATLDWPGDLFSLIRLPRLDGPGVLVDGSFMTIEAVAAMDIAAVMKPTKRPARPVQIELRPTDPTWPPAPAATTDDDQNVTA